MPADHPEEHRLGWAIVGTGTVSDLIAADLSLVSGARLRAVCSREASRADAFAQRHHAEHAYTDMASLLRDPAVDIVYIATPHATHARLAIEVLEAGKHVLIEKPFAVDAHEATRIAQVAAESGRFAMEAMWMRFNPAYRAAVNVATDGNLGNIHAVRASFGLPFDLPESPRWTAEGRSSTLLDQGIYPVTLAIDVLGVPDRLRVSGDVRDDGVDLSVHVTFEYDDGRTAQLSASMVTYLEPTASISGTDGWLTMAAPFWGTRSYEMRTGDIGQALTRARTHPFVIPGHGYAPMLDAVQHAALEGLRQHPWHTLNDTIRTLTVLDGIRRLLTDNALENTR